MTCAIPHGLEPICAREKSAVHGASSKKKVFVSGLLVCGLIISVVAVKDFAGADEGFFTTGWRLVGYHIARVFVMMVLGASAATLGTFALRLAGGKNAVVAVDPLTHLISAGFVGSVILSGMMIVLAAVQWLSFAIVFPIAITLIAVSPWVLADAATAAARVILPMPEGDGTWGLRVVNVFFCVCLVVMFLLLVEVKVLAPDVSDGDTWQHYLHYYKAVINNHGTAPNDVWYHFYLSKGAGLFFLAIGLTDVFGASLATGMLVFFAILAVFDLVTRATGEKLWGMTASIVTLAYLAMPVEYISSFHKHHIPLAAYIVAIVWSSMRCFEFEKKDQEVYFLLTAGVSGVYASFCIPPITPILLSCLFGMLLSSFCAKNGHHVRRVLLGSGVASVLGLVAALVTNYFVTGAAEMAPARFFWDHANKARFAAIWSTECVEFFCLESEPLGASQLSGGGFLQFDFSWTSGISRGMFFKFVLKSKKVMGGLGIIAVLIWLSRRRKAGDYSLFSAQSGQVVRHLGFIMSAIVGAIGISQAMPHGGSVSRMYAFSGILIAMALVLVFSLVSNVCSPRAAVCRAAIPIVLLMAFIVPLVFELSSCHFYHSFGLTSARGFYDNLGEGSRWSSGSEIELYAEARSHVLGGDQLLSLNYEVGPVCLVPGPPLVGEVSYAFGNQYSVILFGTPEEARRSLESLGINYFLINLNKNLFCGIPYNRLFRASDLAKNFSLVWAKDDVYLLTWKSQHLSPVPPRLTAVLEILQNGSFSYLTSGKCADETELFMAGVSRLGPSSVERTQGFMQVGKRGRFELDMYDSEALLRVRTHFLRGMKDSANVEFFFDWEDSMAESLAAPDFIGMGIEERTYRFQTRATSILFSKLSTRFGIRLANALATPKPPPDPSTFDPNNNDYGILYRRGLRRLQLGGE